MATNRIGNSSGSTVTGPAADRASSLTDSQDQAKAQFLLQQAAFRALTTVNRRGSRDGFSASAASSHTNNLRPNVAAGYTGNYDPTHPSMSASNGVDSNLTPGVVTGGGIGCRMGAVGSGNGGGQNQGV